MAGNSEASSTDQLLTGILAMLVAAREESGSIGGSNDRTRTEVILDSAGIPAGTIALLTNKKMDAVRKALQRAR